MAEWHYTSKGERHGPVSSQQLKELAALGVLEPDDNVWKDGMEEWVSASKVKGLFPGLSQSPPPPPPPPAPPRQEIPVSAKGKVPIKSVTPRTGVPEKIAKGVTIGWSLFCLLSVVSHILFTVYTAANTPSYDTNAHSNQAIGCGCGLVMWVGIWAAVALPSLVIWLLARNT